MVRYTSLYINTTVATRYCYHTLHLIVQLSKRRQAGLVRCHKISRIRARLASHVPSILLHPTPARILQRSHNNLHEVLHLSIRASSDTKLCEPDGVPSFSHDIARVVQIAEEVVKLPVLAIPVDRQEINTAVRALSQEFDEPVIADIQTLPVRDRRST